MLFAIWTFHFIIQKNEISTMLMLRKRYQEEIPHYEH